jgi:hypothetical protein
MKDVRRKLSSRSARTFWRTAAGMVRSAAATSWACSALEIASRILPDADIDPAQELAALLQSVDRSRRRRGVIDDAVIAGFREDDEQILAIALLHHRGQSLDNLAPGQSVAGHRKMRQGIADAIGSDPIPLLRCRELHIACRVGLHLLELQLHGIAHTGVRNAPTLDTARLRACEGLPPRPRTARRNA